ncbi:hypothetical protein [Amycolatopsis sp. NPDC059657]|uniref:hypothetical protein n=1 Tax=Amycolatopsis sp. NPDC059657 TaxID=3346899 RepID=UPI00366C9D65
MNTPPNPTTDVITRPRVWLVAGLGAAPEPADCPQVRDGLMRCWCHGLDGQWHTADGRHHAAWSDLHNRFDLVEVTR